MYATARHLRQQLEAIDEEFQQTQLNEKRLAFQLLAINELLSQTQADAQANHRKVGQLKQELHNERALSKKMQSDLKNRIRAKR